MSVVKINTDTHSGWSDSVGTSIIRHVKDAGTRLQRAADDYEREHRAAEASIKGLPSYTSRSSEIESLRMDF